ncbi:hypothetical protein EIP86_002929 [Pleurotus ostreatoroseus]|nr:hypothetical protein EIP86_002929 [Pleurotus ostreatoroseus]
MCKVASFGVGSMESSDRFSERLRETDDCLRARPRAVSSIERDCEQETESAAYADLKDVGMELVDLRPASPAAARPNASMSAELGAITCIERRCFDRWDGRMPELASSSDGNIGESALGLEDATGGADVSWLPRGDCSNSGPSRLVMIAGTESAPSASGIALKDDLESKGEGEKTDGETGDAETTVVFMRDDWSDAEKYDATDSGEKERVCEGKDSGGRPGTEVRGEVEGAAGRISFASEGMAGTSTSKGPSIVFEGESLLGVAKVSEMFDELCHIIQRLYATYSPVEMNA